MCSIKMTKKPNNPNLYLIIAVGLVLIFVLVTNSIQKYNEKMKKFVFSFGLIRKLVCDDENETQIQKLNNIVDEPEVNIKPVKQRLRCLDTFRGFSLFLMIFVNYGSGGYKFLQHVPWHGITLADFVVI